MQNVVNQIAPNKWSNADEYGKNTETSFNPLNFFNTTTEQQ